MQNKGIVIVTAVLLTLACIFYLSFSAASSYYDKKAAAIEDPIAQQDYKDSVKYLGVYSYQKCLETQVGLGLDLKGGMNVILEVSVPDLVENLAGYKKDPAFVKTMKDARAEEEAYSFYSGQILQNARKEAKMTQSELAEKIQTTKSYISKIENGIITPSVGTFYQIISALGMRVEVVKPVY